MATDESPRALLSWPRWGPVVLLVRYGELALKSRYVRRQLEDRLATNVRDMFAANDAEGILRAERGRLFVHAGDESVALGLLRRVFGIVSISPAISSSADLDALTRDVVEYARRVTEERMSFAIRPRRTGQHPYTSQQLARVLGRAVQDAVPGLSVSLNAPDRELHVEVRQNKAYVFHETFDGPGGLPLGSQGEVHAIVEDEAAMVATWLVMRRGCRARVAGPEQFLTALRRWDPKLEVVDQERGAQLARLAAEKDIPLVGPSRMNSRTKQPTRFLIDPLVGLDDDEVRHLGRRVRET